MTSAFVREGVSDLQIRNISPTKKGKESGYRNALASKKQLDARQIYRVFEKNHPIERLRKFSEL